MSWRPQHHSPLSQSALELHVLPHVSRASSSDAPQRGSLLITRDPLEVGDGVDATVGLAVTGADDGD